MTSLVFLLSANPNITDLVQREYLQNFGRNRDGVDSIVVTYL